MSMVVSEGAGAGAAAGGGAGAGADVCAAGAGAETDEEESGDPVSDEGSESPPHAAAKSTDPATAG